MKTAARRFAVAFAAAALALPALASDPREQCSVCGDPTWPAMTDPSPALVLEGPGGRVAPDVTQAQLAGVAPGMAVTEHRPDVALRDWSEPAPEHHAAVLLGARPAHVAAR